MDSVYGIGGKDADFAAFEKRNNLGVCKRICVHDLLVFSYSV